MGKGAALKVPAPSVAASILPPRKGEAFNAGIASKDPFFLSGHGEYPCTLSRAQHGTARSDLANPDDLPHRAPLGALMRWRCEVLVTHVGGSAENTLKFPRSWEG